MSSNGPPPKDCRDVPTSPPAPLSRVRRDDVRRVESLKGDGLNTLVTLAMLGGVLDSAKSESESSE
jgi:hypothetical protein